LDGWHELFCGQVLEAYDPDLADVPSILQQAGYKHPGQVAEAGEEQLRTIFAGNTSTASVVYNLCRMYSGGMREDEGREEAHHLHVLLLTHMFVLAAVLSTRARVLSTCLRDVRASTNSSRSSQTDPDKGGHPAAVSAWEGLNQLVMDHVASLKETPAMFPAVIMPASKVGSSGAWSTCQLLLWSGLIAFFGAAGQCL
jgi:hypothetical protein